MRIDGSALPTDLTVCQCGETFTGRDKVWHCPACNHHWPVGVAECRNCHRSANPGRPSTIPLPTTGYAFSGTIFDLRPADDETPRHLKQAAIEESADQPGKWWILLSGVADVGSVRSKHPVDSEFVVHHLRRAGFECIDATWSVRPSEPVSGNPFDLAEAYQ